MAPKRGRPPPPPGGAAWGAGPFAKGDAVQYWDAAAGEVCAAVVLRVDAGVQPPAYVVQLRGGQTRDTEAPRLARRAVFAQGAEATKEREGAPARSPRRSARSSGGGGGGEATPQGVKAAGAWRGTPRRGDEAAAFAGEQDRSPKRARASPAAVAGGSASRRRRAVNEAEEEEADRQRGGGMGLVHIAVTAMAVTTAALAALRRLG